MCSVAYSTRLIYAGATFEMPDYCLLVVNSRRGRDLGPPRPDTFRRGSGASDAVSSSACARLVVFQGKQRVKGGRRSPSTRTVEPEAPAGG